MCRVNSVALRRQPPRLPLRRELSDCIKDLSSTTEGEITRGHCMHRSVDEHRVKNRSFAFTLAYTNCFRTYSVYLSFRHGVLILYTPCHLPPQREARALPRRAFSHSFVNLTQLAFERRQWRIQRKRQAAAVRERENSEAEA